MLDLRVSHVTLRPATCAMDRRVRNSSINPSGRLMALICCRKGRAARCAIWIFGPKRGSWARFDLHGLAQVACGAIKDQYGIVGGDNGVPVGPLREGGGGCAVWQRQSVGEGRAVVCRETHDKQGEDG